MQVFLTNEAKRQYLRVAKSDQPKIAKKLSLLQSDPLAGKKLTGNLANLRSLRAWPYRILYIVDDHKKEVWVVTILHRQGAYK